MFEDVSRVARGTACRVAVWLYVYHLIASKNGSTADNISQRCCMPLHFTSLPTLVHLVSVQFKLCLHIFIHAAHIYACKLLNILSAKDDYTSIRTEQIAHIRA